MTEAEKERAAVVAAAYVHSNGRGIAAYNLAAFIRGYHLKEQADGQG